MTGFEPHEVDWIVKTLRSGNNNAAADCIEWYRDLLDGRDRFLVDRGLFSEFADSVRIKRATSN